MQGHSVYKKFINPLSWFLLITLQSNPINPELVYLDIQYPGEKPREDTFIQKKQLFVKPDLTFRLWTRKTL